MHAVSGLQCLLSGERCVELKFLKMVRDPSLGIVVQMPAQHSNSAFNNQILMHRHIVIPRGALSDEADLIIGIDTAVSDPAPVIEVAARDAVGDWIVTGPLLDHLLNLLLQFECDPLIGIEDQNPVWAGLIHAIIFLWSEAWPGPNNYL